MKAQDLKNSILQQAIQGKLVEQRPEDGTAEELYQKIQAEKQKLIKEGKIKKDKPLPPISADEIPFDIPETWKWVRLGDVTTYSQPKEKVPVNKTHNSLWTLDLEDIEKESGKIIRFVNAHDRIIKGEKVVFHAGNILYSKLRPYLKKILIAPADGICSSEIVPFYSYQGVLSQYLVYFLKTSYVDFLVTSASYGVKMPRVNTETMLNLLIPLPPLEEQKRIVAKIEELEPLINQYDQAEQELSVLNDKFPEQLKKSILQLAIQGKLVEQLPEDGTAEELYQKIQAEKQKLIKEGKIKKEKPLPPITEDEIPFDIPETWKWVRIGEISDLYTGNSIPKDIKEHKYSKCKAGYCYIGTKDIGFNQHIQYENGIKIPFDEPNFKFAYKHSILLCIEGGSAGRKIGYLEQTVCFGNKLCCINLFSVFYKYVFFMLQSQYFRRVFNEKIGGIIGGVSISNLKESIVPLPPLEEQKRIVAKIDELTSSLNRLKNE